MPYWIVCELLPTKLPHYVLPAFPALLLLMGWALTRPLRPLRVRETGRSGWSAPHASASSS